MNVAELADRDGASDAFSKDSEIPSEARFGQLGAKDAASLAGEDTAEEIDVTFAHPDKSSRQCTSAGSSSEGICQDQPGPYVIIHDCTYVSETSAVPPEEDVVTVVRVGTVVEVEEVVQQSQAKVRGRIASPPGWISLLDVATGYRWACRVEDRALLHKPAVLDTSLAGLQQFAPATPRASVMVAPPSSDRIGTVCRKPRAKAVHRRSPQPKVGWA
ncbi:unnamed protein product [Symbiodinium natans]|uniref:Uncharacterized protein n=1 Tax=Symbiodinium natans TaxID=878477 RepID=A0A812MUU7_9DINO|nr:unnamed protein product [Symbiodinium natans]